MTRNFPVADENCPPGYDNEMTMRMRAHRDRRIDPEDQRPVFWTPEYVQKRIVDAFQTLARLPDAVQGGGSAWPAVLREWADIDDAETFANARREFFLATSREPPGPEAVSLMEEALRWPSTYLADAPLQADGLMLFAIAKTDDDNMRFFLARRKAVVNERIAAIRRSRAGLRRAVAKRLTVEANLEMEATSSAAARAAIRQAVAARFQSECAALKCLDTPIRPMDVLPGKVLSRSNLDKQRKRAAARIAAGLDRDGVDVR